MCDYAEAYILVDGTIKTTNALNATRLPLKNCAPFTKFNLEINDEHVDTAENLDIVMPMYNLIEYSDNYQDSSATLYQYKRDEPPEDDAVADLTANNSDSFKYKIKLLGNIPQLAADAARVGRLNVKIVVLLKYLSNFFRSLEMPLINCKIKLNLTWKKECVLSTDAGDAVFIINDTKLYQGHGIGFDSTEIFTHPNGGSDKNFIIFGIDMTNSKHANNKTKDAFVLGRDLIQKIDDTTIYA